MISTAATVRSEWIDYNGHMRDAYYGLMFSEAIDAFMVAIGIDEPYRTATGGTLYVVEDHRRYLRELQSGAEVTVATGLVGFDDKRLHLWQSMRHGDEICATCETIGLHVVQDGASPRVAAFPAGIRQGLPAMDIAPDRDPVLSIRKGRG